MSGWFCTFFFQISKTSPLIYSPFLWDNHEWQHLLLSLPVSNQLLKEMNVLEIQFQIERSCRESAEALAVQVRPLTVTPFLSFPFLFFSCSFLFLQFPFFVFLLFNSLSYHVLSFHLISFCFLSFYVSSFHFCSFLFLTC